MSLFVDIKKDYGKFQLHMKFEHDQGVLGVLGASGSGKSLTLKFLSGILTPDYGTIRLDDRILYDHEKKICLPPQKRNIGYLFQNYALFPNMTVEKNILCGLHKEKNPILRKEKFQKTVEFLQMQELLNKYPVQLSGGQQQRTALARILVSEPQLLLLDEPFSALDAHLREQLQMQFLEVLRQFQKEVILVSHSQEEIFHLSRKTAVIEKGKLIEFGDTKQIFEKPESRVGAVLTGCKNVVEARKTGTYEVEIPEWGIRLLTSEPVKDSLKAIGIHEHAFCLEKKENIHGIKNCHVMEERCAVKLLFQFEHQQENTKKVWCKITKEAWTGRIPQKLSVLPGDIGLLYR